MFPYCAHIGRHSQCSLQPHQKYPAQPTPHVMFTHRFVSEYNFIFINPALTNRGILTKTSIFWSWWNIIDHVFLLNMLPPIDHTCLLHHSDFFNLRNFHALKRSSSLSWILLFFLLFCCPVQPAFNKRVLFCAVFPILFRHCPIFFLCTTWYYLGLSFPCSSFLRSSRTQSGWVEKRHHSFDFVVVQSVTLCHWAFQDTPKSQNKCPRLYSYPVAYTVCMKGVWWYTIFSIWYVSRYINKPNFLPIWCWTVVYGADVLPLQKDLTVIIIVLLGVLGFFF